MSITHLPAHPRSRGENIAEQGWDAYALGSSPLTRGKRRVIRRCSSCRRLIPAHAGKTSTPKSVPRLARAHPRSRGENKDGPGSVWSDRGSSPLTRGKLMTHVVMRESSGLIPAHAGKTRSDVARTRRRAAHPRSRGENTVNPAQPASTYGSSPLTRGKLLADRGPFRRRRLIPAHAGKTGRLVVGCPLLGAHPRSRGENDQYVRMNGR